MRWLFDMNIDGKHPVSYPGLKTFFLVARHSTCTDGWTACFDFPLWHLFYVRRNTSSLFATDSSFMDWTTKYHITYPPDIHYSPACYRGWCPFFVSGGGEIPRLQAPGWEALPGGPRIAEGLNFLVQPPLCNGCVMHYLCCTVGQGSSHMTDGVNSLSGHLCLDVLKL